MLIGNPSGAPASSVLRVVRLGVIAACLAVLPAPLWRAAEVARQLRQDRRAAALLARGELLREERRYDEAAVAFRQAIAASARATAAYIALGEVEFRRGRTDDAVWAYRQVMARYPYAYTGELYRQVGLFELRGGRPDAAARDLQQAVTLDPQDWLAYHLLGHAYLRLGSPSSARAAWEQAVRLNPGFQPAREQLERLRAVTP
jgi:tetratricopeptide (TPR) repeat protein